MEKLKNGGGSSAGENNDSAFPPALWEASITDEHWQAYRTAMGALERAGIPFLLGGAFGLAGYIQCLRNTKDLDCFVLPAMRERAIDAVTQAGFADYYERLAYDRSWIYRSTKDQVIVDLIWSTPNHRCDVDALWFERASPIRLKDRTLQLMPAEELLWIKLYVLQRDRCDWPDVVNLLHATVERLDWNHLLWRLGEDLPLLAGMLQVFGWLCPEKFQQIPPRILDRLNLSAANSAPGARDRIALLDSRPWFRGLEVPNSETVVA